MKKRKCRYFLLVIFFASSSAFGQVGSSVLYDVPNLLTGKQVIEDHFGGAGECYEEPFQGQVALRCSYTIEKIDVLYVNGTPKSLYVNQGGFAEFRELGVSSLALLGIREVDNGRIEMSNKFGVRWLSHEDNLEVSLFGDGSGKLTHAFVTKLKY